jgi:hypothetical protein
MLKLSKAGIGEQAIIRIRNAGILFILVEPWY